MKSRKSPRSLFWVPAFALSLIPTAALADVPAAGAKPIPAHGPQITPAPVVAPVVAPAAAADAAPGTGDLMLVEAKQWLGGETNFGVKVNGTHVQMYGTVLTDCADKLQITNSNTDASLQDAGVLGFRLQDNGFRACENDHKGKNCYNSACTRVSTLVGSSMELKAKSGPIVIASYDPAGADINPFHKESVGNYVSAQDLQAQHVADLTRQAATCRRPEDLPLAQDALQELQDSDAIAGPLADRYAKEIAEAQGSALLKQVGKQKLNDMDSLIDDVTTYANNNPKMCSKAVLILQEIASREENDPSDGKSRTNYKNARSALEAAQNLDCLGDDEATKTELDKALTENKVGEVGFCATNGDLTCLNSMQKSLSKDLFGKMNRACAKVNSIEAATSCTEARKTVTDVTNLYRLGTQQYQQQQMQQYQMMNQINMAANGSFAQPGFNGQPQGFGGQPGFNGGVPVAGGSLAPGAFPGATPFPGSAPQFGQPQFGQPQFGMQQQPFMMANNFNPTFQTGGSFGPTWAGGSYAGGRTF